MAKNLNKGGRPPRARGERMQRLSVVVRQRYREALDLVARDRRTSASQALEYIITAAARDYEVDGVSVLAVADQLAAVEDGPTGQLQRAVLIPPSLQTPLEVFTVKVLALLDGEPVDITAEEAELLLQVIEDVERGNNDPAFAISVWQRACEAFKSGEDTFTVDDGDGLTYEYELKINQPPAPFQPEKIREAMTRAFALVQPLTTERSSHMMETFQNIIAGNIGHSGSGPNHRNPTPHGPRPRKKTR